MPGSFGGPASADPPMGHDNTDRAYWFYCDLDGDGIYNETPYDVVSQKMTNGSFHDLDSSTVLSYSYDLTRREERPLSYDEQVPQRSRRACCD